MTVHCQLDYYNAMLVVTTGAQMKWLQPLQISAAHVSEVLYVHDWQPVDLLALFQHINRNSAFRWKVSEGVHTGVPTSIAWVY